MVYRTIQKRPGDGQPISVAQFAAGAMPALQNDNNRFTLGLAGWAQTDVTDAGSLVLPIPLTPKRGILKAARLEVLPVGGHVGLPATLPTFTFLGLSLLSGTIIISPTIVDPSTTVAAYQVAHAIEAPNLDFDLSQDFAFLYLVTGGEANANSIIGLRLFNVQLDIG